MYMGPVKCEALDQQGFVTSVEEAVGVGDVVEGVDHHLLQDLGLPDLLNIQVCSRGGCAVAAAKPIVSNQTTGPTKLPPPWPSHAVHVQEGSRFLVLITVPSLSGQFISSLTH